MIAGSPNLSHRQTLPLGLTPGPPPEKTLLAEWLRRAEAYEHQNRLPEAIDCYRRALALAPSLAEAHYNLGNILLDQKRFAAAIESFDAALAARPGFAAAHFNRGASLLDMQRFAEAESCFRQAVALAPEMTAGHYNLGFSLQKQARWTEAIDCFRRAVALDGQFANAWNNLGTSLLEAGRRQGRNENCQEAEECFRKALACDPASAVACNNLGKLHQDRREIASAIDWYREALSRQPDYALAHFNLATAQLLGGSYKEGWRAYEWRFEREDWRSIYPRRINLPRWDGRPFRGRTLWVHTEQGLGDVLQFVRYLPRVKGLGGTVVFEARDTFTRLFSGLAGVDRLAAMSPDAQPETEADLYIPLLSLPGIFGTGIGSIPAAVPYLAADPALKRQWAERLAGEELRIGLVWAGSGVDPRRSLPLAWFTPLTRIAGTRWYGLQKGPAADQALAKGLPPEMALTLIGPEFEDFCDTAAAVTTLDLVISIDTSVAHLAGALARPTYLLLDYSSEWRWLMDREDSPWYPTMRLFRQQQPGDWSEPLTKIGRELETLAVNLGKALACREAEGLAAGLDFYRRRGRTVEALIFAERLKQASRRQPAPERPPGSQ